MQRFVKSVISYYYSLIKFKHSALEHWRLRCCILSRESKFPKAHNPCINYANFSSTIQFVWNMRSNYEFL